MLSTVDGGLSDARVRRRAEKARASAASGWSDEALLGRMLARDATAWQEFMRRYCALIDDRIGAVTRRFGHLIGNADADDIRGLFMYGLQTRDMHKLKTFDAGRGVRFSTWIGVLARNTAWDYLRSRSRVASLIEDFDVECADSHDDLEHRLDACRQLKLMQDRASRFTARDQQFLELYLHDHEPDNISRLMRVSVATVYSKKHKLQSRLRAALKDRTQHSRPVVRTQNAGARTATWRAVPTGVEVTYAART